MYTGTLIDDLMAAVDRRRSASPLDTTQDASCRLSRHRHPRNGPS